MGSSEERFAGLFAGHYGDVLAYAIRRCSSRADAEEVAAETFTVAWRRLDEVPRGEAARMWLFGTARLVLRNLERGRRRRVALVTRARRLLPGSSKLPESGVLEERVRTAMSTLSETDREVLRLQVWEELSAEQIADLLGCSVAAVWKRAERARRRLAAALRGQVDAAAVRGVVAPEES